MKKNLVITGACLMAAGFFLPILYGILMIFGFWLITLVTLGLDWVCCGTVSPLLFIAGLVILIIGIVQKD